MEIGLNVAASKLSDMLNPLRRKESEGQQGNLIWPEHGSYVLEFHNPDKPFSFSGQSSATTGDIFHLIEEMRKSGTPFTICEPQSFNKHKHTCMDLDMDIIQTVPMIALNDSMLNTFVTNIYRIMNETLDIASETERSFYTLVLRKPLLETGTLRKIKHNGLECYKDSLHVRVFAKLNREYKSYLIDELKEVIKRILNGSEMSGCFIDKENVIDNGSKSHPVLLYGASKVKTTGVHTKHALYKCKLSGLRGDSPVIEPSRELDPVETKVKVGRKNVDKMVDKHNLCLEYSIIHDGNLIKKPRFDPTEETLKLLAPQRSAEEERQEQEDDDPEMVIVCKLLDILKMERWDNRDTWLRIIYALANTGKKYKQIAKKYSKKSVKYDMNADSLIDDAFAKAKKTVGRKNSIGTIYNMAQEDDPEAFDIILNQSIFNTMNKIVNANEGMLEDFNFAEIILAIEPEKFLYDPANRAWYTFISRESEVHLVPQGIYKWRKEYLSVGSQYPGVMTDLVSERLKHMLLRVYDVRKNYIEKMTDDEQKEKASKVLKEFFKSIKKLDKVARLNSICKALEMKCSPYGVSQLMDKEEYYIGVGNGVLCLADKVTLIDRSHNHLISRYCPVKYMPYDPTNQHIRRVEKMLDDIFIESPDMKSEPGKPHPVKLARDYVLYFLATSLNRAKKPPVLFIWLGPGSNGKSVLLELHIKTLGNVNDNGYAGKININFLTDTRMGSGPDTEKMSLKWARMVYASELEEGKALNEGKIKEMTSETISGNEKYGRQENFEPRCIWIMAVNHDPTITGNDNGIWRRILAMRYRTTFTDREPNEQQYKQGYRKADNRIDREYIHDPEFQSAYLSILCKYYEQLQTLYNGDITKVPRGCIDQDTNNFRKEQDSIHAFIESELHKSEDSKDTINLGELATAYQVWMRSVKGVSPNLQTVIGIFAKKSILSSSIMQSDGFVKIVRQWRFKTDAEKLKTSEGQTEFIKDGKQEVDPPAPPAKDGKQEIDPPVDDELEQIAEPVEENSDEEDFDKLDEEFA